MKERLLVIAKKYNDIFASVSIEEWKLHKEHILLILDEKSSSTNFPLLNRFERVIRINASSCGRFHFLDLLLKIKKQLDFEIDTLIFSNPVLILNQYVIKKIKPKSIIFLEDGLMNYYDFKPSKSMYKRTWQALLGINQTKFLNSIDKTYLNDPELAVFYYGSPKKLYLDWKSISEGLDLKIDIENKKIFVGTSLYENGYCTVDEYNKVISDFIKNYSIDYYIPHMQRSKYEKVDAPILNLYENNVTLEVYAARYKFELYSFNSTVLFTTKIINPNIVSHIVRTDIWPNVKIPEILKRYSDDIINM